MTWHNKKVTTQDLDVQCIVVECEAMVQMITFNVSELLIEVEHLMIDLFMSNNGVRNIDWYHV